jgi:glutamine phosphoribosylpyrophosphate amidotransferase
MCGIFSLLNTNLISYEVINKEFLKGKNRGPEFSVLKKINTQLYFGFHRLAINGLNSESNQPIIRFTENTHDEIILVCNGEIYNYKELNQIMNTKPKTDSDCEVIIDGVKKTAQIKPFTGEKEIDNSVMILGTANVKRYSTDWLIFTRNNKEVLIFNNKHSKIMDGQYIFPKEDLIYTLS